MFLLPKLVLYDWQRGRLPYFVPPPTTGDNKDEVNSAGVSSIPQDATPAPLHHQLPEQKDVRKHIRTCTPIS